MPNRDYGSDPTLEVEIVGFPGSTQDCLDALTMLIEFGPTIVRCMFVTSAKESETEFVEEHLFVFATELTNYPRFIIVPCGFTSGYGGQGPSGTSTAIILLDDAGIALSSHIASRPLFTRISAGTVTHDELLKVYKREHPDASIGLPSFNYVIPQHSRQLDDYSAWRRWVRPRLSRPLVSPSLFDLVGEFERDPRGAIVGGFRRIESHIRSSLVECGRDVTDQAAVSS